ALEPLRIDRHHVGEGAVLLARLLHDDLPVLLEDLGFDLAGLAFDELAEGARPVEDRRSDLLHATRTQRIGGARPPELRERPLPPLEQRSGRPRGLGRWPLELLVEVLDCRPRRPRRLRRQMLQGTNQVHAQSPPNTRWSSTDA